MTTAPVPRFLLLRGIYFGPQSIPRIPCSGLRKLQHCSRNGSAAAPPSKPRALEKPTKFYPPSHPQRLAKRRTPRHYPGPPLSEAQKEDQKTKRYPNTMPAEGTFMHWFLNNRLLHMSITLTTLFALASIVFIENFHRSTPFIDMLPPGRDFWFHPFRFIANYGHVYKLHTDYVSAETAERRKKKVDDVQKRSRYRKAHGLEDERGFGGWTAKSDAESLGPALPAPDSPAQTSAPSNDKISPETAGAPSRGDSMIAEDDRSSYIDFEGRRRPIKKWLGIWE